MKNDQLIQTFLQLVQIDSPSGEEAQVCAFIICQLKRLSLSPIIDSYGNIIVKKTGFGTPLLLSAHVDTVEPGREIKPVVKNGIIRSNGQTILGADNKVGVAVILNILQELVRCNAQHRNLEIVLTRSEEIGNYGAVNLNY